MSTVSNETVVPAAGDNGAGGTVVPAAGAAGAAGAAVEKVKKARGRKKNMLEYTIPEGGLQSSETPGYNVETMKQLKQTNFADVLDYAKWRVWYFEQRLKNAQTNVDNVLASGSTPEERKENARQLQLITQLERLYESNKSAGKGSANSKLADRVANLFAKVESGG